MKAIKRISATGFIFILIPFVFSGLSFAGLPSDDKDVLNLRDTFIKALAPEENELSNDIDWNCLELNAVKGTSNKSPPLLKKFINFYEMHLAGFIGNVGTAKVRLFAFQKLYLTGSYQQIVGGKKKFRYFLRHLNKDTLYIEATTDQESLSGAEKKMRALSAVNTDYYVDYYYSCEMDQ